MTRSRKVVALLVFSLALAGMAASPAAAERPIRDAATAPGDVVTAQAIWAPGFEYARTWHITYRSTSVHGTATTVSGTIIVPNGSGPDTPIVGYGPGTHGLGDQCAPSAGLRRGDEVEGGLIHQYTARGFAVAITDYEGLGTPGGHPYSVGRSQAHAVLDVVRAAQRLRDTGLSAKAPVAVVGYSQGGETAGWAAEIAPAYAPELRIKGFAVGAPPANLRRVAEYNDGGASFGLVFAAGVGLDSAYPELALPGHLTAAGQAAYADIVDDCTADLGKYAGHRLSDFTTTDILNRPDWSARLAEQALGTRGAKSPVLLYHSDGDEIIPVDVSVALRPQWCDKGTNLTFWRVDTGAHAETAAYLSPLVTQWVGDRLAGKATSGNC